MPRDAPFQPAPIKVSTTNLGFQYSRGLQTAIYPGGLDLLTPSLLLQPGALRAVQNFECSLNGGYSRIGGYERFNGMAKPSDAAYVLVQVDAFSAVPSVGDFISQAGSGATGTVALVNNVAGAFYMIVTQVAGIFNETGIVSLVTNSFAVTSANSPFVVTALNSPFVVPFSTTTIGTAITATVTLTAQLNAQFLAAASDIYRDLISAVPGSGAILGVVHMIFSGVDNVYAFRANVAGTAVNIYKASAAGWVLVPLLNVVSFTAGGAATPMDGDTLTQGGATATIKRVMVASGTIAGSTAAGTFVVTTPNLGFSAGPATTSSGTTLTLSGAQTPIVLLPGGRFEFAKGNFSGQLITRRIYGCDGVNQAFEFDGTTLAPIATGLSPDVPSHIAIHKNFLFLSQGSSMIYSAAGFPFKWTATDGAGEIATGDIVNAMLTLPGAQTTITLGVWMRSSTGLLYGIDPSTWNFTIYNVGIGGIAGSVQNLFDTLALAEPGVVNLQATLNFGNFTSTALTKNIQPFINQQINKVTSSLVSHEKGQYRVFFSDGSGLWMTLASQSYLGATIVQFPNPVNCCDVDTSTLNEEVSYFGSTDDLGYVYQLDTGPSFDGAELVAYITLAWDYLKQSEFLKQYRRARIELAGTSYAALVFGYGLGDNTPLIGQPSPTAYASPFSVALWDNFVWDNFFWDGQTITPTYVDLTGTAQNIQPVIGCSTNYIQPFTISSITYQFSMRRMLRGF